MKNDRRSWRIISLLVILVFVAFSLPGVAQETKEMPKLHFKFEPDSLALDVGETVTLSITLLDENEQIHKMPFLLFSKGRQARRAVEVQPRTSGDSGSVVAKVTAHKPGTYRLAARTVTVKRNDRSAWKRSVTRTKSSFPFES